MQGIRSRANVLENGSVSVLSFKSKSVGKTGTIFVKIVFGSIAVSRSEQNSTCSSPYCTRVSAWFPVADQPFNSFLARSLLVLNSYRYSGLRHWRMNLVVTLA